VTSSGFAKTRLQRLHDGLARHVDAGELPGLAEFFKGEGSSGTAHGYRCHANTGVPFPAR
jgi:hypothetical protein